MGASVESVSSEELAHTETLYRIVMSATLWSG